MAITSVYQAIVAASNIRRSENPSFTATDFMALYPKFVDVSEEMIEAWVQIAHASLSYARWHEWWRIGMGLFIAHHLTLLANPATADTIEGGLSRGVASSKSVTDMSISYDVSSIATECAGWGTYGQTTYGQQLVQFAKLVGKGGMTVW